MLTSTEGASSQIKTAPMIMGDSALLLRWPCPCPSPEELEQAGVEDMKSMWRQSEEQPPPRSLWQVLEPWGGPEMGEREYSVGCELAVYSGGTYYDSKHHPEFIKCPA